MASIDEKKVIGLSLIAAGVAIGIAIPAGLILVVPGIIVAALDK